MKTTVATLIVVLACAASALGAPDLRAVRPPGGQRGTEVQVTLSGRDLADVQEILWYEPGIEALEFKEVNDNACKVKFKIAPDARLGIYDLRVRTASGVSRLASFCVGQFPEVSEKEPNNDFEAPQPVGMDMLVNGVADREDIDYFVVEAKKGERITAEVEGLRLGIYHFDPYVAILDTKRFELSASDDAPLLGVDALAQIEAPEDGQYIIAVRESAYAGNGSCLYRLHVGHFPRPRATVPAGGKLGETVKVRWIGDVKGDYETEVTLPSEPVPQFGLFAKDDQGTAPYPNDFRLSPFGNVIEAEPNDDHEHATAFEAPLALNGVIDKPGDEDHYVFSAKKGQEFDITVYARQLRSPLDSVLYIAKKGGKVLKGDDDKLRPDSQISFKVPEDGEYDISIHDHLKKGGPNYFYRIEVAPQEKALTLTLDTEQPRRRPRNMSVSVPRGSRQAMLVHAKREEFSGDLKILAEDLPEGISMTCDTMPSNQATVPVLFEAKADAPIEGMLTRVKAESADSSKEIPESKFNHSNVLVIGRNNISFWQRDLQQFAIAVAEEAPYSIEVVEPKVPLVKGGVMQLKVVAHREEGFTDPIYVDLPYMPPGVRASRVKIEEGQNEALIPMNANGGAEERTWKLVVDAFSGGRDGGTSCSSQLFDLSVSAPFLHFSYTNAAVEQGDETDLAVEVRTLKDFPGKATVKLVGLPTHAEAEEQTITKDTTELVFHIKTAKDTPAGNHKNLFCEAVITQDGEPITHRLGSTALRVDKPAEPKAGAPKAEVASSKSKKDKDAAKPLGRLEQLRLEAAQRANADASEGGSQ